MLEIYLNMLCTKNDNLQRSMLKVGVQSPGSCRKCKSWAWLKDQGLALEADGGMIPTELLLPTNSTWVLPPITAKISSLAFSRVSGLSKTLGLNPHGVNCRPGIHNIDKKNYLSHWCLSWQPEGWETCRDGKKVEGLACSGDWSRSQMVTQAVKLWGKDSVRAAANTRGLTSQVKCAGYCAFYKH